jgi:hypothetical protein
LVVARISPLWLSASPTAKHVLALGQSIAFNATFAAAGGDCTLHVAPRFAVAMIVAAAFEPPTAKHTDTVGHDTSFNCVFAVAGAVWVVHVVPPLVVVMISGKEPSRPPTAMQSLALGQETPWRATVSGCGAVCALQVEPASVVAAISGATTATLPTATHSLVFGQEMSLYWASAPGGGVWVLQVGLAEAASAVWTIFAPAMLPPVAQQSLAPGQATARSGLDTGELSSVQPAALAAGALARPRISAPTASSAGKTMLRAARRPVTRVSLLSVRMRGAPATAEQGPHDDSAEPYKRDRPPRHGAA